jgi:hypothetical protein
MLCVLLALGGCASSKNSAGDFSGAKKQVAQVVDDLSDFGARRKGTEICQDIYTKQLVEQVSARDKKRSCGESVEDALEDIDSSDLDVKRITITDAGGKVNDAGTRAEVVVESKSGDDKLTSKLSLVKVGDDWRVAALGA